MWRDPVSNGAELHSPSLHWKPATSTDSSQTQPLPHTVKRQPSPSPLRHDPLWTTAPSVGSRVSLRLRLHPQPNQSIQRIYTRLRPPRRISVLERAGLQLCEVGNSTSDKPHGQNILRDKNFLPLFPVAHKYIHLLSTFPCSSMTWSPCNPSFDAYFLCSLAYVQVMTSTLWTDT